MILIIGTPKMIPLAFGNHHLLYPDPAIRCETVMHPRSSGRQASKQQGCRQGSRFSGCRSWAQRSGRPRKPHVASWAVAQVLPETARFCMLVRSRTPSTPDRSIAACLALGMHVRVKKGYMRFYRGCIWIMDNGKGETTIIGYIGISLGM